MYPPRRGTERLFAWLAVAVPLTFVWRTGVVAASSQTPASLKSGKEIYLAACAACHGAGGRGASQTSVGFEQPLPDFTDCRFAAREPDVDWVAIVHGGGPARGFSEIMPSFSEALTTEQIQEVTRYLRTFCREPAWPRGELNLPRPLVTEKAYPEDEVVLTTTIPAEGAPAVGQEILYEKRFGARNQLEVKVPFQFARPAGRVWTGGVGDIALAWKRVLAHSLGSGSIFSVSGEAKLPTGDQRRGLGKGVTVFESFATYGQILPRDSFAQFQGGFELPTRTADAPRAAFWRGVFGKTFTQGGGLGRAWSPMVELLADRELVRGEKVDWDLLPQLHVTLSKRQHIMANFGVRFPLTSAGTRTTEIMFYLLWDWFDGGLREGW